MISTAVAFCLDIASESPVICSMSDEGIISLSISLLHFSSGSCRISRSNSEQSDGSDQEAKQAQLNLAAAYQTEIVEN
jgi:hypothetical protein